MFGDLITSLIRTNVAVAVGSAAAWLGSTFGIVVPEDAVSGGTAAAVGVAIGAFYSAVRAAEERWPVVGRLLGSSRAPHYPKPAHLKAPRA